MMTGDLYMGTSSVKLGRNASAAMEAVTLQQMQAAMGAPVVSSLPGSPTEGQLVTLLEGSNYWLYVYAGGVWRGVEVLGT
jgi:hypothetical protein